MPELGTPITFINEGIDSSVYGMCIVCLYHALLKPVFFGTFSDMWCPCVP